MPERRHCRHCLGDCPGSCLVGESGKCIHGWHEKGSRQFRWQLLLTRKWWHRVFWGTKPRSDHMGPGDRLNELLLPRASPRAQLALGHPTLVITLSTYAGEWPDTDDHARTIADSALGNVPCVQWAACHQIMTLIKALGRPRFSGS